MCFEKAGKYYAAQVQKAGQNVGRQALRKLSGFSPAFVGVKYNVMCFEKAGKYHAAQVQKAGQNVGF